jgi:ubiquinone/menaquinone biosynthesis C-methylase UbiE/ribosomal protein S27E
LSLRRSDYENYDYQEFWEDNKRYYEDRSERMALRKLLKAEGTEDKLIIDIGCGFGRLFDEYSGFSRIAMVDYSLNNLRNARMRVNKFLAGAGVRIPKVIYIAADATRLPFRKGSADTILTVRVIHHLADPGKYFDEIDRILKAGGLYLLEFANKRNLKNIIKFLLGRMKSPPFSAIPLQVGDTIRNYHPKDIYSQLADRKIDIEKIISVSNYRAGFLKRLFGSRLLLLLESIYQSLFPCITLGPSVFIKGRHQQGKKEPDADSTVPSGNAALSYFMDILICPGCGSQRLDFGDEKISCKDCGRAYVNQRSIIDFRL